MHLLIDMQGVQTESKFRGIGRYTNSLVSRLINLLQDNHDVTLLFNSCLIDNLNYVFDFESLGCKCIVWHPFSNISSLSGELSKIKASKAILNQVISNINPDIYLIPSLFEGYADSALTVCPDNGQITTVVVSHDLIPLVFKDDYLNNQDYSRFYLEKIEELKKANYWIAISESSKLDLTNYVGISSDYISNCSEGCDLVFLDKKDLALATISDIDVKYGNYILYTGGVDFRKNIEVLLKSYALYVSKSEKNVNLVFAGKIHLNDKLKFWRKLEEYGVSRARLIFTDYVTDDYLKALYSKSFLFVFPSLYEGFGLPVIEAMACGSPVIGSNVSSIPEIISDSRFLFDPENSNEISDLMLLTETDPSFRLANIQNGQKQLLKFNWDITAEKVKVFLTKTLNEKRNLNSTESFNNFSLSSILPNRQDRLFFMKSTKATCFGDVSVKTMYVDISELYQRDAKSGIQRVVRCLLSELLDNQDIYGYQVIPVYATPNNIGYRVASKWGRSVILEDKSIICPVKGDIFFGLDYQTTVQSLHYTYYKFLRESGVSVYFLIHDLLPYTNPEWWSDDIQSVKNPFDQWLRTLTISTGVIGVSKTTIDQYRDWLINSYPIKLYNTPKLYYSYSGSDFSKENNLIDRNKLADTSINQDLNFLMVGTIEPRKGISQVIAAFELLWDSGSTFKLTLVGKKGWLVDSLLDRIKTSPYLGTRLIWLDHASDTKLNSLYQQSSCLIAASYGEGFGLPLVEAMDYDLPIIARNIPIFKEIADGYADFFDCENPKDLANFLAKWETPLHQKINPNVKISWQQSGLHLLTILGLLKNK